MVLHAYLHDNIDVILSKLFLPISNMLRLPYALAVSFLVLHVRCDIGVSDAKCIWCYFESFNDLNHINWYHSTNCVNQDEKRQNAPSDQVLYYRNSHETRPFGQVMHVDPDKMQNCTSSVSEIIARYKTPINNRNTQVLWNSETAYPDYPQYA